jgi:hypothetical protein
MAHPTFTHSIFGASLMMSQAPRTGDVWQPCRVSAFMMLIMESCACSIELASPRTNVVEGLAAVIWCFSSEN